MPSQRPSVSIATGWTPANWAILIADTLPVQLDFVRSGDTAALVGQRPWEMGYRSMYVMRQMMDGVMPSDPLYTGLDKCDASNIDTCVGG